MDFDGSGAGGGRSTIGQALQEIADGGMVVVLDDEGRPDEGDLVMAAGHVTPPDLAFMVRHTSGVICVGLTGERCDALELPLLVPTGHGRSSTPFTHPVDLASRSTTGISATDRAATISALADPSRTAAAFTRPGRVFPLRARDGGVLAHAGRTEAAVDLARLAGLSAAGALCEIVNDDGSLARRWDLERFAATQGLPMITIADLVAHRRRTECVVERTGERIVPTPWGEFRCVAYRTPTDGTAHVAFVLGDVAAPGEVLVRVHGECLAGDIFRSLECDCRPRLETAMARVAAAGRGAVVYLRDRDGRGCRPGAVQGAAGSTGRRSGAHILLDLGIRRLRLLTDDPADAEDCGLGAFDAVACEPLRPRLVPRTNGTAVLPIEARPAQEWGGRR